MPHATSATSLGELKFVFPDMMATYGDWRDDLFQEGYAIIPNVLSPERSAEYVESMFQWLEKFPLGFDRNDPKTWREEHLPAHMKGGMYHGYSVSHEKFVWDIRTEPAIIDAFSKIWGTDKLLVSFDGINLTLPRPETDGERVVPKRWPHQDQDSMIRGFQCAQGIVNLAPNGPDDGGLVVMKKSHLFNDEFFKTHSMAKNPAWGKVPDDWHGFNDEEVKWFEDRGCEIVKVNCPPGSLVVWDSRCVHWNILPEGKQTRAVVYACYTPAALASPADLQKKKEIFEKRERTTHWPHRNFWKSGKILRLGKEDPHHRDLPFKEPELSDRLLKLAGALPYES